MNVAINSGIIASEVCGADLRMIKSGQNSLSIVNISNNGQLITISENPRASFELTAWTTTGEMLARYADVIREPI